MFSINNKLLCYLIIFLLGLYFVMNYSSKDVLEGFKNNSDCPNILIQKGTDIYLYNSKKAKVPGINPVKFKNLEDYVEFLKWQRSQGIECPVLFLQHSYDAQGKPVYTMRPSPTDLQGGLPTIGSIPSDDGLPPLTQLIDASRDDPPYNEKSYPGFDPQNLYQGDYTPLDKMFSEQETDKAVSTNPMDTNWGGIKYTRDVVKSGYYADNEVSVYVS